MRAKIRYTVAALFSLTLVSAQAQDPSANMPKLQMRQMSGRVEVDTPAAAPADLKRQLPSIPSGSTVRVVSGTALFQTDNHAQIQARRGDSFVFTSYTSSSAWPASLSISAAGPTTHQLGVSIGNQEFLLADTGAISIAATGAGQTTVKVEAGDVQLLPASPPREGASIVNIHGTADNRLSPGDTVVVQVPADYGFPATPSNLTDMNVTRLGAGKYEITSSKVNPSSDLGREEKADTIISSWPEISQTVASLTMEKYGPPARFNDRQLVWDHNGQWKRTTVYRTGVFHNYPIDHEDVLQQTISYNVPQDKISTVENLDIGLKANIDNRELSSISEAEETNFLALNLANDVITGKISPDEARSTYARTVSLSGSGKSAPYLEGLTFTPSKTGPTPNR